MRSSSRRSKVTQGGGAMVWEPSPRLISLGSVSPNVMRRLQADLDMSLPSHDRAERMRRQGLHGGLFRRSRTGPKSDHAFVKGFIMLPDFGPARVHLACDKTIIGFGTVRVSDSSAPQPPGTCTGRLFS